MITKEQYVELLVLIEEHVIAEIDVSLAGTRPPEMCAKVHAEAKDVKTDLEVFLKSITES